LRLKDLAFKKAYSSSLGGLFQGAERKWEIKDLLSDADLEKRVTVVLQPFHSRHGGEICFNGRFEEILIMAGPLRFPLRNSRQ